MFASADDPRITGQGFESSRFGAERIPCRAERVNDVLLILVKTEREISFPQVQPDPFHWVELR